MRQSQSSTFAMQLVVLVASAAMCVAGCANSGRTLDGDPETWASSISVGDHLNVITNSGDENEVYVTEVNESGISTNNEFIAYSDIQSIQIIGDGSGGSGSNALVIILTIAAVAVLVSLVESEVEKGFIN